jgi:hypothetical protein
VLLPQSAFWRVEAHDLKDLSIRAVFEPTARIFWPVGFVFFGNFRDGKTGPAGYKNRIAKELRED